MKSSSHTLFRKVGWLVTRVWVWLPALLLVLATIALILLPTFLRQGVEQWLVDQGAEQVNIEDVDINLFTGEFALRNFRLRIGGENTLILPQVRLRFARLPLLRRQLVVQDLYLQDTSLAIEQMTDGRWRFAGLDQREEAGEPAAWHLTLRRLEIANSNVDYTGPAQSARLEIERAVVLLNAASPSSSPFPVDQVQVRLTGRLQTESTAHRWSLRTQIKTDVTLEAPPGDKPASWRVRGNGEFQNLDVGGKNLRAISAERIDIKDLAMTGLDQVTLGRVTGTGLSLAQPMTPESAPPLLKVSPLTVSKFSYQAGTALTLEGISASEPELFLSRDKQGGWHGLTPLRAFLRQFGDPASDKPELPVRIASVVLEKPGSIVIRDEGVQPAFQSRVTLNRAQLNGFDTGRAPATPADLTLSMSIGKYATAELQGQLRAYAPDLAAGFLLKLREFELPALSSYSARTLGYRLTSGQLGGELDLQIADGKLDGKSRLAFSKLSVKPVDEAAVERWKARLAVPLETGIAMLRDKNDNVNLEVNISGDTGDPKFDLTDAINQALTKAMRTASVSYLKHYFQPYGTLITVAELAGKAMQVRLDPLVYAASSTVLTPEAEDYLAKVGKLLQERDKLAIKLCGKSVMADGLAPEAALRLAGQRAEILKDILVTQYGVAPDRLFLCEPEQDKATEASPRVELLL